MRRTLAWLLTAPLALIGSQVAHEVAYVGAAPNAGERASLLAQTGHGYLQYAPLGAALAVAVALAALALALRETLHGAPGPRLSAGAIAVVPIAAFALQEHLERLMVAGNHPLTAALEPTFLLGIVLQLPFALLAYGVARMLLRATRALARVLAGERRPALARAGRVRLLPTDVTLPRAGVLARGYAGRGPPLTA